MKGKARTFGQDLMKGEHKLGSTKKATAMPGQGGKPEGKNAWKFKTADGYKSGVELGKAKSAPKGLAFGEVENYDGTDRTVSGTSIFDPVLTELAYRWFCPPKGLVVDPFAGGSVRGIVASRLGYRYLGVDLQARQVKANEDQAFEICRETDPQPKWVVGDSQNITSLLPKGIKADFVFSCPPYADLEVYSDDPLDLSRMSYPDFLKAYRHTVAEACSLLKPNRFACFVVGDVRDKEGLYRGFPWHTVEAFQDAGLRLYNEAVLVTAVGSLPVRVGRQFASMRKLGKTHQNVLVFVKGDPAQAAKAVGPVEFGDVGEVGEVGEVGPVDAKPDEAYGQPLEA